jgi:hypothetical protein
MRKISRIFLSLALGLAWIGICRADPPSVLQLNQMSDLTGNTLTSYSAAYVGSYYCPSGTPCPADGGEGLFVKGGASCTPDGGRVVKAACSWARLRASRGPPS